MLIGIILSLISSILIAIYLWPKKFSKFSPHVFLVFLGFGYFLSSVVSYLIMHSFGIINENFFSSWNLISIFNGVNVMIAILLYLIGIDKMGVAKSSQFKSFQGSVGALLIVVVFSEWLSINIYLLLLGIIIMWVAALVFNVAKNDNRKIEKKWITLIILSGFLFAIDALLKKVVLEQGLQWSQLVYVSLFTFMSAFIYSYIKEKNLLFLKESFSKDAKNAFIGGVICYASTILGVLSLNYLEGSIAVTIRELSALWNVIFGIFLFKEIDFKKHKWRLSFGFILVLLSLMLLFLSRF